MERGQLIKVESPSSTNGTKGALAEAFFGPKSSIIALCGREARARPHARAWETHEKSREKKQKVFAVKFSAAFMISAVVYLRARCEHRCINRYPVPKVPKSSTSFSALLDATGL